MREVKNLSWDLRYVPPSHLLVPHVATVDRLTLRNVEMGLQTFPVVSWVVEMIPIVSDNP